MRNDNTFWLAEGQTFATAVAQNALKFILSSEEVIQNSLFSSEPDKLNNLISRAMIRTGLSHLFPDRCLSSWRFGKGSHGKPYVEDVDDFVEFNLTHCKGLILCAFSKNGGIGIDVERIDRCVNWQSMSLSCLSSIELEQLMEQPEVHRKRLFLTFWVLKESYLKALGLGITPYMNSISFIIDDKASTAKLTDSDDYIFTYGTLFNSYVYSICIKSRQKKEQGYQAVEFKRFEPWKK